MVDDDFVEISTEIEKKIIKKGKQGKRPFLTWNCRIEIILNETYDNDNFKTGVIDIVIGYGCNSYDRLIERCVETMHLDEESLFVIKSVDNVNDLKVTIILISYLEKPYIFEWTDEEKINESNHLKNKGAQLFKDNNIEEAFYKFSNALKLLLTLDAVLEYDEPGPDINNLIIALYNNLARCQLHFKNYKYVIDLCSKSIDINSTSKALYRRALAYIELVEYEKAQNDLLELIKLEPNNKAAIEKFKLVRDLDKTNRDNYNLIVKKMFGKH